MPVTKICMFCQLSLWQLPVNTLCIEQIGIWSRQITEHCHKQCTAMSLEQIHYLLTTNSTISHRKYHCKWPIHYSSVKIIMNICFCHTLSQIFMCSWTLPCVSSLVPSVLHLSHGFQCSPTSASQTKEGYHWQAGGENRQTWQLANQAWYT